MKLRSSAVLAISINTLVVLAMVGGYHHFTTAPYETPLSRSIANVDSLDQRITGTLDKLGFYPALTSESTKSNRKLHVGFEYLEVDSMTALSNASAIVHNIFPPMQARLKALRSASANDQKAYYAQIADLNVKLLNLAPNLSSQIMPEGIRSLKNDKARHDQAVINFSNGLAHREVNKSVKSLVSDFLNVMYGEEKVLQLIAKKADAAELEEFNRAINSLENLTRDYLNTVWNRPDMIRTRYLGRAFYSSLVAIAEGENPKLTVAVKQSMRQAGIVGGNYSSAMIMTAPKENMDKAQAILDKNPDAEVSEKDLLTGYSVKTGDALEIEVERNSEKIYKEKMRNGRDLSIYDQFRFQLRQAGIGDGEMKYFGTFMVGESAVSDKNKISVPWIFVPRQQKDGSFRLLVTAPEQYFSTKDVQLKKVLVSNLDARKRKYDNGTRIHMDHGLTPVEKMLSKFAIARPVQSQKISDAISPFLAEGMVRQVEKDVAGLGFVYANAYAALRTQVLTGDFAYIPFYEPNVGIGGKFDFDWNVEHSKSDVVASRATQEAQQEYDQLLQSWGFEDWIPEMKANLAKETCDVNPKDCAVETWINAIQLKRNIKSYQAVNDARELASFIMARIKGDLNNKEVQKGVVDIAARMLANKPSHPPVDLPVELKAMPYKTADEFHKREHAIEEYIYQHQFNNIETHARVMLADITKLLYGRSLVEEVAKGVTKGDESSAQLREEIKHIYQLCWKLSERTYLDALVWQANFFGQALSSLIMIESARMDIPFLETNLKERLKGKSLFLETYFTNKFVQRKQFTDADRAKLAKNRGADLEVGESESFEVANGTMLLTKNMAAESSAISHGAAAKDLKRADLYDMMAGVDQIALTMGLGDYFAPLNPKSMKAGPNKVSKISDWLTQKESLPVIGSRLRKGYSHIDYIYLREYPVDTPRGKKTLYRKEILDAYPTHFADDSGSLQNAGGPRKSSLNQVIDRTWHSRAIVGFREGVEFRKAFLEDMRLRMLASKVAEKLYAKYGKPTEINVPILDDSRGLRKRPWTAQNLQGTYETEDKLQVDKRVQQNEIKDLIQAMPTDFRSTDLEADSEEVWSRVYEFVYLNDEAYTAFKIGVLMDDNAFPVDRDVYPKIYKIAFDKDGFRPIKVGEKDSAGTEGVKVRVGMTADISSEQFNQLHFAKWGGLKGALASASKLGIDKNEDAEAIKWHNLITEEAHKKQIDMIKKGWIFMWVTERVHVKGFVYCSYYLDIAFKLALGFSPEFEKGGYRTHVKYAGRLLTDGYKRATEKVKALNLPKGKEPTDEQIESLHLSPEEKIAYQQADALSEIFAAGQLDHVVSPTALLINKGVPDANIKSFDFEDRDAFERAQFRYKVMMPRDPLIEAHLETILPRSEEGTNMSKTYQPDAITTENTEKLHVVEEAITIPLSQGFKFVDIGEQGRIENGFIARKRLLKQLDISPEEVEEILEVRSR